MKECNFEFFWLSYVNTTIFFSLIFTSFMRSFVNLTNAMLPWWIRYYANIYIPETMRASFGPTVWMFPIFIPNFLLYFRFEIQMHFEIILSSLLFLHTQKKSLQFFNRCYWDSLKLNFTLKSLFCSIESDFDSIQLKQNLLGESPKFSQRYDPFTRIWRQNTFAWSFNIQFELFNDLTHKRVRLQMSFLPQSIR